jgi:hypothetical protein
MHAYAQSISKVWLVNTPISAFGLFLVVFIRGYTLKRTVVRGGEKKTGDVEKGAEQGTVGGDPEATESESLEDQKSLTTYDNAMERTSADSATNTRKKTET